MSMLHTIGCALGRHVWEPLVSTTAGAAHHKCLYCGKVKRVDTGRPPEAHDKSQIHH